MSRPAFSIVDQLRTIDSCEIHQVKSMVVGALT